MAEHWLMSAARNVLEEGHPIPPNVRIEGDIAAKWATVTRATGIKPDALADAVAAYFQIERAVLQEVDQDVARKIPENVARTRLVIPIDTGTNTAYVATADPADQEALDELAVALKMPVVARVASPVELESKLESIYGSEVTSAQAWGSIPRSLLAAELILRRSDGSVLERGDSATAKLFVELLRRATHMKASDTHVQPYGGGAVIRNRIDGVLYRAIELPKKVHEHLIRHVKVIAGMDSTVRFVPQDGELRMELEHREVDLRISVIPVESGERLVIRLLPQSQVKSLDMLNLAPTEQVKLQRLARSSAGMLLMTGPTGSGKTSLLYSMMAELNTPDINIMTVEEPVEYRLRGASQINVDTKTGLTFASALRSILRQDPDVVMIGEIRDEETASIATQAAMTGHVVLSTVHTLDALLSIIRMQDLGVSATTLADALRAVVSQRLIRSLCLECRVPLDANDLSEEEQQFAKLVTTPQWRPKGCEACRDTGFSGRVPVVEIVEFTEDLQDLMRDGSRDLRQMESIAALNGTRFLAEGFAERVAEGTTTVSEILRVYGQNFFTNLMHAQNLRITEKKQAV